MSNRLFEHDFQVDLEPNENTYCTQDIQWQYINDNNMNNYANAQLMTITKLWSKRMRCFVRKYLRITFASHKNNN